MYLEERSTGTLLAIACIICLSVSSQYKIFGLFAFIFGAYLVLHLILIIIKIWKGVFKNGKK